MLQRFLIVRVGEHRVAMPETSLVEVARAVALERVPSSANDLVAGVCNLHGVVTLVLDLRARFGLAARAPRASDALVFVRAHQRSVGLLVDQVDDFVAIGAERAAPASSISPALGDRCQIAQTDDGVFVIAEIAAFVSATEIDAATAADEVACVR